MAKSLKKQDIEFVFDKLGLETQIKRESFKFEDYYSEKRESSKDIIVTILSNNTITKADINCPR